MIYRWYEHVRDTLNMYGGSEALQKHLNIITELIPAARKIGFPDWPLRCADVKVFIIHVST